VASPKSGPWWVKWVQMLVACPNTQGCSRVLTNPLWLVFGCRFKLDLLVPLPSLILGLPTRPSTPFWSWKSGGCLRVSTFRNLTLWNPQVGFTPWLGSASICFNCDQNNCIIVACDNTYTMESKDELIFVDFFFHPIPLVVCN
jgi:hypothetical protein